MLHFEHALALSNRTCTSETCQLAAHQRPLLHPPVFFKADAPQRLAAPLGHVFTVLRTHLPAVTW